MRESYINDYDLESEKEVKNIETKKLISFAKINKYFIFPFLSPIFIYFRDYFISLAEYKYDGLRATFQYEFIDGLMHSACIILYLISYLNSRTQKKEIEKDYLNYEINKNIINNTKEKTKNNNNKIKIFYIILIIAASYTVYISNSKILSKKYNVFEIRIYHLVFNTIFCKMILKDSIYKHQLLSLILASIGWIFISIPIFQILETRDIIPNILFFFGAIFYPLYLVLFKYIISKYYISQFLNMLYIGIFLLIISVIGLLIYSLIDCNNLSYLINILDISKQKKYFVIAFFLGVIVKFIFCYIILNFSPNIFLLTNVISSIIGWISKLIMKRNDSTLNIIFKAIGFFIIFFSTLIYNEIIIFNFLGLNKNTAYDIDERAKKELQMLLSNESTNYKDRDNDENNNEDNEEINKEDNKKVSKKKNDKKDNYYFEVGDYIVKNQNQNNENEED